MEESDATREEIVAELREVIRVMNRAATEGRRRLVFSLSGLIGGDSSKIMDYTKTHRSITGEVMTNAMAYAMSSSEINASMGRIVAAPTAGACGIVPAVLQTFSDQRHCTEDELVEALTVAGAMGIIIGQNATISGRRRLPGGNRLGGSHGSRGSRPLDGRDTSDVSGCRRHHPDEHAGVGL